MVVIVNLGLTIWILAVLDFNVVSIRDSYCFLVKMVVNVSIVKHPLLPWFLYMPLKKTALSS